MKLTGLLRACELLEPDCLVLMLKAVKHLSMNVALLDVLQNANAIEILIRILEEQSSSPHSTVGRFIISDILILQLTSRSPAILRKCQTIFSKHATTSAASTDHGKKKLHRRALSHVCSESSRPNLLSNNSPCPSSVTLLAPARVVGRFFGSMMG